MNTPTMSAKAQVLLHRLRAGNPSLDDLSALEQYVKELETQSFTIRDSFAAAALTGMLGRPPWAPELAAEQAYSYADAMLAERGKA